MADLLCWIALDFTGVHMKWLVRAGPIKKYMEQFCILFILIWT